MADLIVATLFRDNQAKLGMPDIDELLAEQDVLIGALAEKKKRNAARAAKFAFSDKYWEAQRVIRKSLALLKVKDAEEAKGDKGKRYTDKVLDAMAHADADYRQWVNDTFTERGQHIADEAEYAADEKRIDAITERIRRANITGKSFAMEPR